MAKLSIVLRKAGDRLHFWCPACDTAHVVSIGPGGWTWDGDAEAPTFSPSIRVKSHDGCVCHSFVRAGRFEYCSDCTHAMAGSSAPIAPWPERVHDGDAVAPDQAAGS